LLEYWIQNGEATWAAKPQLRRVKVEKIGSKETKRLMKPLFQPNGKLTSFSQKMFGQLNARNWDDAARKVSKKLQGLKEQEGRTCAFCGKPSGAKLKGWIYPFIITKEKFPNLYPSGSVETLNTCRTCAWKSVAAYTNLTFQTNRVGEESYTSINFLFADSTKELQACLTHLQGALAPTYFRNVDNKKIRYDLTYYPNEFLFSLIYYLSNQIRDQRELKRRIGGVVLGYKIHGRSRKAIYDTFQVIDNLTPIIRALRVFRTCTQPRSGKTQLTDPLTFLFRSMRASLKGAKIEPHIFIERERFLRTLLADGRIDWGNLEQMVFRRLGEERRLPYINDFLIAIMEELNLNEKELYEQVSREGYRLARTLVANDTLRTVRARAYELRRTRRLDEFLWKLNLLQLDAESIVDDRPFRENESMFQKLRAFFLIGFCNGLFSGKREVEVKAE
jgi:hypothetical protein